MNKSFMNILGIGILAIILVSFILTITGLLPGKMGDRIITGSSLVIAIIMFYFLRKRN